MRENPSVSAVSLSENPVYVGETVLISITATDGAELKWSDLPNAWSTYSKRW